MDLRDLEGRPFELALNPSSKEQVTYYGLNDRATNVFSTTADYETVRNCAAKVFWAETHHSSEHEIVRKVKKMEEIKHDVREHVVCYKISSDMSTGPIQGRLSMQKYNEARVFNIIVLHKLAPITELSGDEFLNAWWATVKCHRALWKHGVYHRDISPTNLMYYRDGEQKVVGVLNDFDLASTSNNPTRNERTGTIPFMALDLLTEQGLGGNVKYQYQHDAESFIWVLVWISLRYSDGKKVGKGENGKRPLDDWVKNRDTCRKDKRDFLGQRRLHMKLSGDHALNFRIANACLRILHIHLASRGDDESDRVLPDEKAYQELLCNPIAKLKPNLA